MHDVAVNQGAEMVIAQQNCTGNLQCRNKNPDLPDYLPISRGQVVLQKNTVFMRPADYMPIWAGESPESPPGVI
jgi:hypothetical protein